MESKSKDRRKHCDWRMLLEFKPEKPVKLQQIRDHFRHRYGVFLWQKKSPIGQIFRCRHYFNTNRRKSAVKCPYKIRWDNERGILWETGQHEHEHQTGGTMEQHKATQPMISKTEPNRKAHYHNKIKSSIKKKPGTTRRKIKEKNRNPAKVTVICKGIEENCIAKDTVAEKQIPYIHNTGKEWQFLAKIDDNEELYRVRKAHGLKTWFYEGSKIRLRCSRDRRFPVCPYRGIYVKAERTLYYRGMHCHGEQDKKRKSTISERIVTVAEQPMKRKNQQTKIRTHCNDAFDADGDDDEYILNLMEQIAREEAETCEANGLDNEEKDEENAGVVKSRSKMKPKMKLKKKKRNQANITVFNEENRVTRDTVAVKQQILYIYNRGKKWHFLAKIDDEADFDRIRKAHGLKIWFYDPDKIRLRCSRATTFPSCPYRGIYVKAQRTLYYRRAHLHDENGKKIPTRKKNKINMIFERKKEQFMKGDGQGTVVGQAMNDAVAKHSTNKSYINWHGQKWDLLAKIEDEAHFKQIRLNQILHKYNKKTVQLRCPMRHEKYGRCPYHGLYFIGPRLLYHRLVHNHPECEKNGKQVGKGPKMAKKKHNSRTYQQKSGTVEGSINFKDQRSERGDDQRSACQKRKSRSLVPGCSHSKISNCENDHDGDSANDDDNQTEFVLANFEDDFKRASERPPLVFWREKKLNTITDTVAGQTMNDATKDAVAEHPKTYTDKFGKQWKLLVKIVDDAYFKRLHLSLGLTLNSYSKTTIQFYCSSRLEKYGRCPYRAMYLRGPRLLYHRFAHNHSRNKKDDVEIQKNEEKQNSRSAAEHKSGEEGPIIVEKGIDQRSSGGSDQRSIFQKRKASRPVSGCSYSNIENCEIDGMRVQLNHGDESAIDGDNQTQFVLKDFEDDFKRTAEQPPLVFWRENMIFEKREKDDAVLKNNSIHMNTIVTGQASDIKGTVAEQAMKEGNEDTVATYPSKIYLDKFGNQWKLLAKIENKAHFNRLRLNQGLKLNTYNRTTIHLYCSMSHKKCRKCPYRGLYLVGPRLLYHRFAHNHPKIKSRIRKRPKTAKKKHKSRTDQQKQREMEESINFKDQRTEGGDDQRSACQKRKTSSPLPDCPQSKILNSENEQNEDSENDEENQNQKQLVIEDFEDEFKRAAEQPPLVFWRENGTFALAMTDLATKTVGKMLLFLDRGNSLVEVCKFEGDQLTGQREKWAITEPEQFRHEFHRICAEYLV